MDQPQKEATMMTTTRMTEQVYVQVFKQPYNKVYIKSTNLVTLSAKSPQIIDNQNLEDIHASDLNFDVPHQL